MWGRGGEKTFLSEERARREERFSLESRQTRIWREGPREEFNESIVMESKDKNISAEEIKSGLLWFEKCP